MSGTVSGLIAVTAAYLVGGIPFGFLTARWVAGIDIRDAGSGNIGATNVARVLGKKWGLLVLLLDGCKGALPTALLPPLLLSEPCPHLPILCGLSAIVGHMFPVWLKFRGGKGVATALGAVAVLAPQSCGIAAAVFAAVLAVSRIVSLSSILAAAAFAIAQLVRLQPDWFTAGHWSTTAFSVAVPLLIVVRHRANIVRLWRGTEPRFGRSTSKQGVPPANDAAEPAPSESRRSDGTASENSPRENAPGGVAADASPTSPPSDA